MGGPEPGRCAGYCDQHPFKLSKIALSQRLVSPPLLNRDMVLACARRKGRAFAWNLASFVASASGGSTITFSPPSKSSKPVKAGYAFVCRSTAPGPAGAAELGSSIGTVASCPSHQPEYPESDPSAPVEWEWRLSLRGVPRSPEPDSASARTPAPSGASRAPDLTSTNRTVWSPRAPLPALSAAPATSCATSVRLSGLRTFQASGLANFSTVRRCGRTMKLSRVLHSLE
jgi:hypothetical protein